MEQDTRPVLVLGATGYVGRRLVPLLLDRGCKVRAAGRSDRKIRDGPGAAIPTWRSSWPTPWTPRCSPRPCAVAGRCSTSSSPSGRGNRISPPSYRRIAYSTVHAARAAGVDWIIYFTGLGNPTHLSDQLCSRYEVGEILALGGARVTQLRRRWFWARAGPVSK